MILKLLIVLCAAVLSKSLKLDVSFRPSRFLRTVSAAIVASQIIGCQHICGLNSVSLADDLPSLSRCFNAVRDELDKGASLQRLKADIDTENWQDILTYTREYDAGFRGGVLKSAWKQLGDAKERGIQISNSFTFDLIALNKAARKQDSADAKLRLEQVRQDLKDFLALEPK